jgi:hypothetical protein
MNSRRVAALLRELADELEDDCVAAVPSDVPPPVPPKRPKRIRSFPRPLHPDREPSELDQMRATKMARRRGLEP